jgi:hypothetical protein
MDLHVNGPCTLLPGCVTADRLAPGSKLCGPCYPFLNPPTQPPRSAHRHHHPLPPTTTHHQAANGHVHTQCAARSRPHTDIELGVSVCHQGEGRRRRRASTAAGQRKQGVAESSTALWLLSRSEAPDRSLTCSTGLALTSRSDESFRAHGRCVLQRLQCSVLLGAIPLTRSCRLRLARTHGFRLARTFFLGFRSTVVALASS